MQISMTVNGNEVTSDIEPRVLLVHYIREVLGLTGTHWGCDTSNCGTCVVLMDGQPVKSCTVLAAMAAGHDIRTVEGLAAGGDPGPGPAGLHGGARAAVRFLHPRDDAHRPGPAGQEPASRTTAEIRQAISGQICRCTGYATIVRSVQWAAAHPAGETCRGGRGRFKCRS